MWGCRSCGAEYDMRVAWCARCGASGLVAPLARRAIDRSLAGMTVRSARDVVRSTWDLRLFACAPGLAWIRGAMLVLYGLPGAGKSTIVLRLAHDAEIQRVGILAVEEGYGATLAHRLRATQMDRHGVEVLVGGGAADLLAWAAQAPGACLVIDSITPTALLPDDLRQLVQLGGLGLLLVVAQSTKAGLPAGSQALMHEADAVIRVESLRWHVEKSRFGPSGIEGPVLPVQEAA